ncbi:hypothetical protein BWI17_01130 [Betaproteobacteria bacterium GR16-43]|nr:hypothetical protein BWI17_01130 [Betaproteobacteria bacterium GR16-43]
MRRVAATLVLTLASCHALAGGALAFLSTQTTVTAGEANSFMNRFADCSATPCPVDGMTGYATPTRAGTVTVATQKTTTDLVLRFTVADRTHRRTDDGSMAPTKLTLGDKIIVQLDPNNSRGATLGLGPAAIDKDYRYEVTIKEDGIATALRREPVSGTGWNLPTPWCMNPTPTNTVPQTCSNPAEGTFTLTANSPDYAVELSIPLASIGSPAGDFGLAILIVNDLGHDHGMPALQDLTAVVFPAGDLPASSMAYNDPGLIPSVPLGAAWANPNNWGTGYVTAPPAGSNTQLAMSHSPTPWVSDSIKLGECEIARWEDIGSADTSLAQVGILGWYRYYDVTPCTMGIWVKVTNTAATVASARLLVMWSDGGVTSDQWRVVKLTAPISFGAGDSAFRINWDSVPPGNLTPGTHPCLRVYILPETLLTTFDETAVNAINNPTKLAAFETAYGFPAYPWNARVAQMNFTNLIGNTCPNTACPQPLALGDWGRTMLASLEWIASPAHAQNVAVRGLAATPIAKDERPRPKADYPFAVVAITAFAVPERPQNRHYVFIEPVGGAAWAIPMKTFAKPVTLGVRVTNPAIAFRDFGTKKVHEVKAPVRRIILAAHAEGPEGMGTVRVKLPARKDAMKPGEARIVKAQVTVERKKDPEKQKAR